MRKIILILLTLFLLGCESSLFKKVFKEQQWSENYALADGVRCTTPEMIDGDINTAGKTMFPEKVYGSPLLTTIPSTEAEVILPEKKSINKIVIRSENLKNFSVLASTGEKDSWKVIKEFDKNAEKEIVVRTSVVTDRIKIRAKADFSFSGLGTDRANIGIVKTGKVVEPEIQEIELYGFK